MKKRAQPNRNGQEVEPNLLPEGRTDENNGKEKEGWENAPGYIPYIACAACVAIFVFFVWIRFGKTEPAPERKVQVSGTKSSQIQMTEAPETGLTPEVDSEEEKQTEAETEKWTGTQTETQREGNSGEYAETWREQVFGTDPGGVVSGGLQVRGLSQAQRNALGFRESDFVSAAGQFLSGNGIQTGLITFGDQAETSCPGAAYFADLDGYEDKKLCVILYASYPGEYILTLLDVPESIRKTEAEQDHTASMGQMPQAQGETPQTALEETQDSYNAASLDVTGIPQKLHNYLTNEYEMQYSLYDYLYKHGKRDVIGASVAGYEIDADNRLATIQFLLSDGSSVTGTYRKDENSYTYR